MILLYGENLSAAKVSVKYPGVKISKVQLEADGKHAFVWLALDSSAKPGMLSPKIKTPSGETDASLSLSDRTPQQGKFQGVNRNDVIYLIMPDRFADGDPSNNQPLGAVAATYNRSEARAYHGGDNKGVQQHLPYLKDLGGHNSVAHPAV